MRLDFQKSQSPDLLPNILVAIPYCDKRVISTLNAYGGQYRFLLDSGAFTAWKSNKEITVDEYCAFIKSLPFKPYGYFTLDKIGDPIGTRNNLKEILDRGFEPIPIFTRGSDPREIEEFYKISDVVGVGGLVGTNANKLYLRDVMKKIGDRPVHWLGFTSKNWLTKYKPFSCDSSSWHFALSHRYLGVYLGSGVLKYIYLKDFREDTANSIALVKPFMDLAGEDVYQLRDNNEWKYDLTAGRTTFKAHAAYAIDVEKRFGTKIFFALAGGFDQYFQIYLNAWKDMRKIYGR